MRLSGGHPAKRLLLAAIAGLIALIASAEPASAGCGEEYRQAPAHSRIPGGAPLAIGDSVLADAVPPLARAGFEADGMVCRQMSQGIEILRQRQGTLPHLVVLALGTNGEVTGGEIDGALQILGPNRILALVTPHGSVVPSTPAVIRAAAESHPRQIILLDWDRLAASHRDWFAPDGVHLGGSAGIEAFAGLVAGALSYAGQASTAPEAAEPAPPEPHPRNPGAPETIQPPPAHHSAAEPKRLPPASTSPGRAPARTAVPSVPATATGPSRVSQATAPLAARASKAPVIGWVALVIALLALAGLAWRMLRRRRPAAP
jgi:hypothetical protein